MRQPLVTPVQHCTVFYSSGLGPRCPGGIVRTWWPGATSNICMARERAGEVGVGGINGGGGLHPLARVGNPRLKIGNA